MNDFNQAVKLEPQHYFPFQTRGDAFMRRNQIREAIADYEQAVQLAPEQLKKSVVQRLRFAKSKLP
jgi:predicted negative regulator of RcsB-dependent stress response